MRFIGYMLILQDAAFGRCSWYRPLNSVLEARTGITHASSYILWLFPSSLKTPLWHPLHWHAAKHYDEFQASCATLTAFNHWEKPGNVLILYPPTLPPRLPSVPPTLISPAVSGVSACCRLHSGGVHVSRSGGSAALFCALVHRITALDNRVVVEGESGAGPGAGPGEAPWLFIARSPKSCASFFYSSF